MLLDQFVIRNVGSHTSFNVIKLIIMCVSPVIDVVSAFHTPCPTSQKGP